MALRYLPLACFGKLPFYREYLEANVQHPTTRAFKKWVRAGREEIASELDTLSESKGDSSRVVVREKARLRVVMGLPKSSDLMAAVIRGSRDLQGRSHPFFTAVSFPRRPFIRNYALLPLALASVWEALDDAWDSLAEVGSREIFAELLPSFEVRAPDAVDAAQARYRAGLEQALDDVFDRESSSHLAAALGTLPARIKSLKGAPEGGHVLDLPGPADPRQTPLIAAAYIELVNRHFFWKSLEPAVFWDTGDDAEVRRVFLVYGALRPQIYGWLMGCDAAAAEPSRYAASAADAPSGTLAQLVKRKLA